MPSSGSGTMATSRIAKDLRFQIPNSRFLPIGLRQSGSLLLLAVCAAAATSPAFADKPSLAPQHEKIYQRAAVEFLRADFFKPLEPRTADLTFKLAPLILQEVVETDPKPQNPDEPARSASERAQTPPPRTSAEIAQGADRLGSLTYSNGVMLLDTSKPTVYADTDTVQINGRPHARFSYLWCYSTRPGQSPEAGLPWQGIRLTLDSAGQPVIWEVLADTSSEELIFVSQNLEAAAMAEFGKAPPDRRFSIERSREEAPNVVVARVIDDGPTPLGPIVYLRARTRSVGTLICRCMNAQAKTLRTTASYELAPMPVAAPGSLVSQARSQTRLRPAFWPGDTQIAARLENCLRLPKTF
jgi:hypothetical protein